VFGRERAREGKRKRLEAIGVAGIRPELATRVGHGAETVTLPRGKPSRGPPRLEVEEL
jgi:hypothetical protein